MVDVSSELLLVLLLLLVHKVILGDPEVDEALLGLGMRFHRRRLLY